MLGALKTIKNIFCTQDIKKANTPEEYIGNYLYNMDTEKKNKIFDEISSIYKTTVNAKVTGDDRC